MTKSNPKTFSTKSGLFFLSVFLFLLSVPLFSQTDSRYDSGLNLPFNEKAGDLNPQTGTVTVQGTDVSLPGRAGMDFSFGRVWTTAQSNVFAMSQDPVTNLNRLSTDTVESRTRLGAGWTSTVPMIYDDESSGTLVQYLFINGSAYELDQTGMAVKNMQKSNILWYDYLDKRIYHDSGVSYGDRSGFNASELAPFGVADTAAARSRYVLIFQDNSKYWFRPDGKVMMQEDRTGLNRIWYYYDAQSRLRLVVDTIGRKIRFAYDGAGNLETVSWDVTSWEKGSDDTRTQRTTTRTVRYGYEPLSNAQQYPVTAWLRKDAIGDGTPQALVRVTDPMGHATEYAYTEGKADFTYDDTRSHSTNVYLLLTRARTMAQEDGTFLNERNWEYNNTNEDETNPRIWRKYFYSGYMEYFRATREYVRDRHGRVMNDTAITYYENGENGNRQCYTAVLEQGNVKTEYTYSISGTKSKDNVLDTLTVKTSDGFLQLSDYGYNNDRSETLEETYRQGTFVWREKFQYDAKMRPTRIEDKMGLVTVTEYDEIYGIPVKEYRTFESGYGQETYQTERVLTDKGQVESETIFLKSGATVRPVRTVLNNYDEWGNVIAVTNALGEVTHTEYDTDFHAFPVKVWQNVKIGAWQNGRNADENWHLNPDLEPDGGTGGLATSRIRSWKEWNTDGTPWLEVDNDGYAVERFYDMLGNVTEEIMPDLDDERGFATSSTEAPRIVGSSWQALLIASRKNNPGKRLEIRYETNYVKSEIDIDRAKGHVKVTAVQKDGLDHVEEELEYEGASAVYAKKVMSYDTLGRQIAITDPDAGESYVSFTVSGETVKKHDKTWVIKYDDLGRQSTVYYPETVSGRTDRKTFSYNDAENSVTITDADRRVVYQKRNWNDKLILVRESGYGTEAPQEYQYVHDALGRKIRFFDPKGIETRYRYDERNLLVEQAYGESGGSDLMRYDDAGRLVRKTDRNGQVLAMTYDELGRNIAVLHYKNTDDERTGTLARSVRTVYDRRGNPVRVSSEKLIEHYVYDPANRVLALDRRLTETSMRGTVAYVWGGNAATQTFSFSYVYNDAGMVTRMTYPDGAVHEFAYDPVHARLTSISEGSPAKAVTPFVTGLDYNRSGQVTAMRYRNQTTQSWTFDNRKRISHIDVTGSAGTVEDLSYTLSPAGNVLAINNNEYSYDGFNRVSGAKTQLPGSVDSEKLVAKSFGSFRDASIVPTNGSLYDANADLNSDDRVNGEDDILASYVSKAGQYDIEMFAYDANGNRTTLVQNGDEYTYTYGKRNQLVSVHLRKAGENTRSLFAEYTYDENGNTTSRTIHASDGTTTTSFEYDTLNRLVTTTSNYKTTRYAYDNAGNRLYKKDESGTTFYLRHGQIAVAMDVIVYAPGSTEGATHLGMISRYVLSGDLVAGKVSRKLPKTGPAVTEKSYYHLDHQNSTKAVTGETGEVVVQYVYRAFGEQLRRFWEGNPNKTTGDAMNDARYTYGGKELDDDTNLYYFNARYYDATTGRFINVDPVQDGSNWYVYCGNNPMNYLDPDGRRTYFVNGINNPQQSGPPSYATAFGNELSDRVVKDVRLFGIFNNESGFSGTVEGSGKVATEMINLDAYSDALVSTIVNDLEESPLQEDEELNIVGYSGGGQIALNAAEKLSGKTGIDNVVLIGTPVMEPEINNIGRVTSINGGFDPLGSIWPTWDNKFAGWIGHTDYFNDNNIGSIADMVNGVIE